MRLEKITKVNGFDEQDLDNAKQNNYAWSMVEFEGYLYVGTGRNVAYRGMKSLGFEPTKSFVPDHFSQASEIWRYRIGSCHRNEWERVYKMPEENGTCLFRCMVAFENEEGVKALYGGSYYKEGAGYLLMSKNGLDWESIPYPLLPGYYVRPLKEFSGKLYASNCQPLTVQDTTYLYVSENPEKEWRRVNTDGITGEIFSMQVFNKHLYIGTMPAGGFAIWKSEDPESGIWECVVDRGAGDALNEIPMSMAEFLGYLYVGTGINGGVYSTDSNSRWVLPKGFDIIRITKDDNWDVLVGKEPVIPTNPSRGIRRNGIYSSGFGNLFNPYCWTLETYRGSLYVGSWDSAILYKIILTDLIKEDRLELAAKQIMEMLLAQNDFSRLRQYKWDRWVKALITSIDEYPKSFGFDFLKTKNGFFFKEISINGFENEENYGVRNMLVASDGKMYIGTANPTQGCEVWAGR